MIGMVHGYGLSGSGSNLWTRSVVKALCDVGETVHLLCQDREPEAFSFVAEVREYEADGSVRVLLDREVDFPGRAVVHRPVLDVLPTYVRPSKPSQRVASILDLPRDRLEEYLERNVRVLERMVEDHGVQAFHVNHVLLLAEALRRLKERTGAGYGVMPHGSAIEYVVRRSDEMKALAGRALAEADRVFSLNTEIRTRLAEIYPELSLEAKTVTVRAGVDTRQFRLVDRQDRRAGAGRLKDALADLPRGRGPEAPPEIRAAATAESEAVFLENIRVASRYDAGKPDQRLEESLDGIRWEEEKVVIYVGRLIGAKGVASLLMALPGVLRQIPGTRLVLVGAGPLREVLEAATAAASMGDADALERVLAWGEAAESEGVEGLTAARRHLAAVRGRGELGPWLEAAKGLEERIVYTGYLEHTELCELFPLADAAVFPSVVPEASPLVVAEAAASGAFPVGLDQAGMGHVLRDVGVDLPDEVRSRMLVNRDPSHTVDDIVGSLVAILSDPRDHRGAMRATVEARFDWRGIAQTLAGELHGMTDRAAVRGA